MTRIDFLKLLLSLPFGAAWAAKLLPQNTARRYAMNTFYIAGYQYYQAPALITAIKQGEMLRLAADPENNYDKFAVAIYRNGVMLGHVPRKENKHISRMLRQDCELYCIVTEANPERDTWEMLEVEVGV